MKQQKSIIHGLPKVFADTSLPIIVEDLEGIVIAMNPAAEEAYGWQAEELIGLPIKTIVPTTHHDQADSLLSRCRSGQIVRDVEGVRHCRDGTIIPVLLTLSLLSDESGNQSIASMATDISALKEAERKLRTYQDTLESKVFERTAKLESALFELKEARWSADLANKAKSEFLANMSHEIRTPMNAILGMTHLSLETELSRKQRSYLERIERSARDLLGLVDDILDFSKIEAGKLTLEETTFSLDSVMEKQRDLFALPMADKGIELLFNVDPHLPPLFLGDPLRLGQILTNLLSNALKFTEQGDIVVAVSNTSRKRDDYTLRFEVQDSGIGIQEKHLDSLFESFRQVDASTTRRFGGTGLGLAICQQLVTLMNGEIGASSEPGKGSLFWFEIELNGFSERRTPPAATLGGRAILVESHPKSAAAIQSLLKSLNWQISRYTSVFQAIKEMKKNGEYDLVVVSDRDDLNLEAVIRYNSEQDAPRPLLTLVPTMESDRNRNCDAGPCLPRPLIKSQLVSKLSELLGDKSNSHESLPTNPNRLADEFDTLKGLRALVVEDNSINRDVLREMLANVEARTNEAKSGEEAVEMASNDFEVILMDIQMPGIDGLEATRLIRDRGVDIPIIAVTANVSPADVDQYLQAGMDDFVAKPIDPRRLYLSLRRMRESAQVLDKRQSLRLLMGNENLYHQLMTRFFTESSGALEELRREEPTTALKAAHNMKSTAGTLGLKKVARLARAAEACFSNGKRDTQVIEKLEEALKAAKRHYTCRRDNSRPKSPPTNGTHRLEVDLSTLLNTLQAGDVKAIDLLRDHIAAQPPADQTELTPVLELAESFDFAAAAELLKKVV